MNAEFLMVLVFALAACSAAVAVAASTDPVHALLAFLASSLALGCLILESGPEVLAAFILMLYLLVTVFALLVMYPLRKTKAEGGIRAKISAGILFLLFMMILIRGGKYLAYAQSGGGARPDSPSYYAVKLLGGYYFPLGVLMLLFIAVLIGGHMIVKRNRQ